MSDQEKKTNLSPKKISEAVSRATLSGFEADLSNDAAILQQENYSWDDLNKLREEVATSVMDFVTQVAELSSNKSIINNLGARLKEFTDTVTLFFKDMAEFGERVKAIRLKHEHLSGPITDMVSYNNYNSIAFEYHTLCNELAILVTPTMSQLVLITSEAIDASKQDEPPVTITGETLQ